jgi:predicted Zn-dependent protease
MSKIHFSRRHWKVSVALVAFLTLSAQAPAPTAVTDQETELGEAVFKELKGKTAIIAQSPLYDSLKPLTTTIAHVAQPRYQHPFNFYLIHDSRPNAFSVPGGAVYVTDALLYFVKNTEELAAVLCHEVSHTIHHDSMNRIKEMEKASRVAIGTTILLGPSLAHILAAKILTDLYSNAYSRDVETRADLTGADICAQAGYNPHGMVWLMEDFKQADPNAGPQLLADHPSYENRIRALEAHFAGNPHVFAKFSLDRKQAAPFRVPEDAPVVFLRR